MDNSNFFNRELSWLEFNSRVLEEALIRTNPLLERVKFLSITGSNLDEFFMIRVAGLEEQKEAGYKGADISGMTPSQQLEKISVKVHNMVKKQYDCLMRSLIPLMKKEGLRILKYTDLDETQKEEIKKYYETFIYPIITPMAIDQSRPFPQLPNKSINIAVFLDDEESEKFAILQVPSILPRFYQIRKSFGTHDFIPLEEIIINYVDTLFPGYSVNSISPFRITRNADLSIDEEDTEDLLEEIEKSLIQRRWGFPVRLEIYKGADQKIVDTLEKMLEIDDKDVYQVNGPLDISAFMFFATVEGFYNLKYDSFKPSPSPEFFKKENFFDILREKDLLLFHPYQSFEHVTEFLNQAAEDPDVLAIKQTLYRVSGDSPIVRSLIKAAENGKQVTVLVELKARFDEENNIQWAKRLEKAGCYVVYGLVGLKTHGKILLVVRKEADGIKRYVHLSTGNYNDKTAKLYTDIGFFTSKENIAWDASALFNVLTGYSQPPEWKSFSVAPVGLKENIINMIRNEVINTERGKKGRIIFKANSLLDTDIIEELYKASVKGVEIKLIIRGICALIPGVKNMSENIETISIVGRFLEHTRIYYFENGGKNDVFLSSADLMPRNLVRRVEIMFPIEDSTIKNEITDILGIVISDTEKARILNSDGSYKAVDKRGKKRVNSQEYFIKYYKEIFEKSIKKDIKELLKPVKEI